MKQEAKKVEVLAQTGEYPDYIEKLAEKVNISPNGYLHTINQSCKPGGREFTYEERAQFLITALKYDLNPLVGEIYAFPKKKGGIQIIVGIDGWIKIMNRRADFNGLDTTMHHDEQGNVYAITATIWRRNLDRPIVVTEYMNECLRPTLPWQQWPIRMLRHKATIQCIRYAFGLADIIDPDEAERQKIAGVLEMVDLPQQSTYTEENVPPPPASAAAPESREPHMSSRQKYTLIGCAKKVGANPEQLTAFLKTKDLEFDLLTIAQASDLIGQWKGKGGEEPDFEEFQAWLMEQGEGVPVDEEEPDVDMTPPPGSVEPESEPMPEKPADNSGEKMKMIDEIKALGRKLKMSAELIRTQGKNITNRRVRNLNQYGIEELGHIRDTMQNLLQED